MVEAYLMLVVMAVLVAVLVKTMEEAEALETHQALLHLKEMMVKDRLLVEVEAVEQVKQEGLAQQQMEEMAQHPQ
jgi:hypothetical protein